MEPQEGNESQDIDFLAYKMGSINFVSFEEKRNEFTSGSQNKTEQKKQDGNKMKNMLQTTKKSKKIQQRVSEEPKISDFPQNHNTFSQYHTWDHVNPTYPNTVAHSCPIQPSMEIEVLECGELQLSESDD